MAKTASTDEEVINHYGAVRMRVTGSGSLRMTMYSYNEVKSHTLLPLTLASTNYKEPNRLCNFTQQKAKLEIKTTGINETFNINKIIVFIRPVAKSYPE